MSATIYTRLLSDFGTFSRAMWPDQALRSYQLAAARPILEAVEKHGSGSFVLELPRQAGKDELLAQLQAYLLARFQHRSGSIVLAAPTFAQAAISRNRVTARLTSPLAALIMPAARPAAQYRIVSRLAAIAYRSAEPTAHARGETASRLLIANEAQEIAISQWDSVFSPMTASTDAPSLYSGTPWTEEGLLHREQEFAEGGGGHIYKADWQEIAAEVPAYGRHVRARIARLGEGHPFIQSEYCLKEIGSAGGLFPASRQAQMHGQHERRATAEPGRSYALLLDVAGGDEDQPDDIASRSRERQRDSTALTVVEVDRSTIGDVLLGKPTYRVVDRREWVGQSHASLYGTLRDLALNVWRAQWFVADATGIGAGLVSFLDRALRGSRCKVLPFVFSQSSKSLLGWSFLGVIESGRLKDYADDGQADTARYWQQVSACSYSVQPGPGKLLKWSVAASQGHDDLLISAGLVGHLDDQDWRPRTATSRIRSDYGKPTR